MKKVRKNQKINIQKDEEEEEEMNLTKKEKEKEIDTQNKKRPEYVSNEQMIKNGIEIVKFSEEETNKVYQQKEINKEKNEKKEVISRKKLLIEKEKNNINTLTEKKQKESINLINYANLEKRENKRYTKDSLQDAIKTKENTIGNQTKESETIKKPKK